VIQSIQGLDPLWGQAMSNLVVEKTLEHNRHLKLIHGDLTEARVDAIVNAANTHLQHGGGVAGAIARKGGKTIQKESDAWIREYGLVTQERPALTTAGDLPTQFIIHAVGPVWGEGDEERKLHAAVYYALLLADSRHFRSLALPAISTGIFGFPKELGAQTILDAILQFLQEHPETSLSEIQIVLIDQPSVNVFANEFLRRWPEVARS
jgi:O-acetyl-ADP-ribose deacetylase (regulator of RNase III)